MKILHIFDHSIPLHSGYTFRSRAILEHQRQLGWETCHLTSPKHNLNTEISSEVEEIDGLTFYRTPSISNWIAKIPLLNQFAIVWKLKKRLLQVVREVKPDIIHAHSPALNGIAAVQVGKKLGIPVVYEVRAFWEDAAVDHGTSKEWGVRYRLSRALETYVFKRADAITTICEGLRSDIVGRGIAESKVSVIPNAVDISRFTMNRPADQALKSKLGLDGKSVFGFIGSFYAYEGLPILLQAMKMILDSRDDVRILLVGGGPQEKELKQLSESLNLQNHVIFTGRVPHNDVQSYYDLVDIFVYPRISMRLTELVTPLKPLEAMAQGKLVVASDIGGHRELIRSNVNGLLFKSGDHEALANVLLDMLNKRPEWLRFQREGRMFVENERNWTVSVNRYLNIYPGLLERGQA